MDEKKAAPDQTTTDPTTPSAQPEAQWPIHGDALLEDSDPPALSDVLRSHEHEHMHEQAATGDKGQVPPRPPAP